ncbi:MAG: helix-turn-helix domain-containing protein [Ruminiclostridium sp.]
MVMLDEYPEVLDVHIIATILRVSKGMIYNLLHTNQLRGFLIGRKYRILKSDLICYLNNTIRSEKKNDTAV